jgi:hypothetical protein
MTIKEYKKQKLKLYSCPRFKNHNWSCTDDKRKYYLTIEGRWYKLQCGECHQLIINFKNWNDVCEFLKFINSLIKDDTREIFVFNYRKSIKKWKENG